MEKACAGVILALTQRPSMSIQSIDPSSSEIISALAFIPDCARAIDIVLTNALEARAKSISIECHSPFTSFSISDDGPGFALHSLMRIGKTPFTTKMEENRAGKGLFFLSKVASIKIASRSSLSGRRKLKRLHIDGSSTLEDDLEENSPIGSAVDVSALFQNSPIRARHLSTNFKLQGSSISKLLLEKAAIYSNTSFSWCIDGVSTKLKSSEDSPFVRLSSLFSQFDPTLPWVTIDEKLSDFHINGIFISPFTLSLDKIKAGSARLLYFNRQLVSSPELFALIDAAWSTAVPYYHPDTKLLKRIPVVFISFEGAGKGFEVIRSLSSPTSLLRCPPSSPLFSSLQALIDKKFKSLRLNSADPTSEVDSSPHHLSTYQATVLPLPMNVIHPILESPAIPLPDKWKTMNETRLFSRSSAPARGPQSEVASYSNSLGGLQVIGQSDSKFIIAIDRQSKELVAFDQHAVRHSISNLIFVPSMQKAFA